LVISAILRSLRDLAAVSTAFMAASSQDDLLVPTTSMILYVLDDMFFLLRNCCPPDEAGCVSLKKNTAKPSSQAGIS
jgi:hypothetical protein